MNRTTLQKLNTIIDGVECGEVAYSDLLSQIKVLRDDIQKRDAGANRSFSALAQYYVIESILRKQSEITGR